MEFKKIIIITTMVLLSLLSLSALWTIGETVKERDYYKEQMLKFCGATTLLSESLIEHADFINENFYLEDKLNPPSVTWDNCEHFVL